MPKYYMFCCSYSICQCYPNFSLKEIEKSHISRNLSECNLFPTFKLFEVRLCFLSIFELLQVFKDYPRLQLHKPKIITFSLFGVLESTPKLWSSKFTEVTQMWEIYSHQHCGTIPTEWLCRVSGLPWQWWLGGDMQRSGPNFKNSQVFVF